MPEPLRIRYTQGPIFFKDVIVGGLNNSFSLWNGVTAAEFFTAGAESANYVLTLEKGVKQAADFDPRQSRPSARVPRR